MKKLLFLFFSLLLVSCGGGSDGGGGHAALCNDGTYSDSKSCSGTCSSHGGVKEWYVQCGSSASKLSLSAGSNEIPEQKTGLWTGQWVNKQDHNFGTLRLNIAENGLIDGMFFNKDNTLNSKFHSHVDDDGTMRLFLDAQQSLTENTLEYPADISLNNINNQLMGRINIQKNNNEEIREVELHKE